MVNVLLEGVRVEELLKHKVKFEGGRMIVQAWGVEQVEEVVKARLSCDGWWWCVSFDSLLPAEVGLKAIIGVGATDKVESLKKMKGK